MKQFLILGSFQYLHHLTEGALRTTFLHPLNFPFLCAAAAGCAISVVIVVGSLGSLGSKSLGRLANQAFGILAFYNFAKAHEKLGDEEDPRVHRSYILATSTFLNAHTSALASAHSSLDYQCRFHAPIGSFPIDICRLLVFDQCKS